MTTERRITFTVEGSAPFPVDMLRYDACYPASESDSAAMERLSRRRSDPERVTLTTTKVRPPTDARWLSFGWRVVGATPEGGTR